MPWQDWDGLRTYLTRCSGLCEGAQQRLCFLQVAGVEAFGELTVHQGKELARRLAPTLFAPKPRERGRATQFISGGALPPRDFQRLLESYSSFFQPVERVQCDPFEAMKVGFPLVVPGFGRRSQPHSGRLKGILISALPDERFGEACQAIAAAAQRVGMG